GAPAEPRRQPLTSRGGPEGPPRPRELQRLRQFLQGLSFGGLLLLPLPLLATVVVPPLCWPQSCGGGGFVDGCGSQTAAAASTPQASSDPISPGLPSTTFSV